MLAVVSCGLVGNVVIDKIPVRHENVFRGMVAAG